MVTITRTITLFTLILTFAPAALAAPPSSTLGGTSGTLSWTVTRTADGVTIEGKSAKWTVTHRAKADLTPLSTDHTDADGRSVTIEYSSDKAVVTLPDKTITHDESGLWDADTLDIRLGQQVVLGKPEVSFHAIDTDSGKVYSFATELMGTEDVGGTECTHVKLQLTGLLKMVGPKFHYWFASNGQLMRFEGPAGTFSTEEN